MPDIKKILKQLFCKHNFNMIAWREENDRHCTTRWSMRTYVCEKCGKKIEVDGRFDPYFK